ncbi:hypothetical protein E2C01_094687 [Portunus trituberculatus]|uniref:Uncharacterized protein n=1 Tax=Portunus trituberculatus TaxID=210409 RepID=A0A5B7JMT5_PORTR|nr:hypothetical protein [Portunus trituberculatus]
MLQCAPYIKNFCQTIHTWKVEETTPLTSNGLGTSNASSPSSEEQKVEEAGGGGLGGGEKENPTDITRDR